MAADIPCNVLVAANFLHHFDRLSVGSIDLTQLTLGLDGDSAIVSDPFDDIVKR